MNNKFKLIPFLILIALLFCGCSNQTNNKYDIISLGISPAKLILNPGGNQQYNCQAVYGDGAKRDFTPKWNISDNSLGNITEKGLFNSSSKISTVTKGQIIASYNSIISTSEVIIDPAVQAPDIPQNITFSNVNPYELTISWQTIADASFIISYGKDALAENGETINSITNSASISGLESNTKYYFKVKSCKLINNGSVYPVYSAFSQVFTVNTADYPLKYSINGNKIVDDKGATIIFRGVNILDPGAMDMNYHNLDDSYFAALESWKVKIIRIPVHPQVYKNYGSVQYFALLNKTLDLAAAHKIYAIIDYHSIGFPPDQTSQSQEYAYTDVELKAFWSEAAKYFKNDDRVVFYEIFNEPTTRQGATYDQSWSAWKTKAEELIDIIRNIDSDAKIIVGGIDYSYNISFASNNPINKSNIVYGTHPYPGKTTPWNSYFGNLAVNYPVFATEFGFDPNSNDNIIKADTNYGNDIINYLESKGISWTVWNFSTDWAPALLSDWNYNGTTSGNLFKSCLLNPENQINNNVFSISSAAFTNNSNIPIKYANIGIPGGQNISIPISWSNVPQGTRSLAISIIDISAGDFIHWLAINIPSTTNSINEQASRTNMPIGSVELLNDFGVNGYGGPQPPTGTGIHNYVVTVYCLNSSNININTNNYISFNNFKNAISQMIIGQKSITGTFSQ